MAGTIQTFKIAVPPLTISDEINRALYVPETLRASITLFDSVIATLISDGTVTMTGGKITGLSTPTLNDEAANKEYVDSTLTETSWKSAVEAATTADISLSALQTIDGFVLSEEDRVLVKNQATGTENGLYAASTGAWSRTNDLPVGDNARAMVVTPANGATNKNKLYVCSNGSGSDVVGTDALIYVEILTGTGSPGGADTQVQFNDSGSFGGSADFTWDGTSLTLAGLFDSTNTTNSTSAITGAVMIAGGMGVAMDVFVGGDVTATQFTALSDATFKTDVEAISDPLSLLGKIDPVKYRYNFGKGNMHYGVLAQDLQEQGLENIVSENEGHLSVNYNDLTGILLAAVQELSCEMRELKKKIDKM